MSGGGSKLQKAMQGVDWTAASNAFFSDTDAVNKIEFTAMRIAVLSHQLEKMEGKNPAISFIRETQICSHYTAVLISMGLYKPAAASIRSLFETFQYYTYFRTHPSELSSIGRSTGYFIDKRDVLSFHKEHTEGFTQKQQALGLISKLDKWYASISAIIHGQLPGVWVHHTSVSEICHSKTVSDAAVEMYSEGVDILIRLFLCTLAKEIWIGTSTSAKNTFLHGINKQQKEILGLDSV